MIYFRSFINVMPSVGVYFAKRSRADLIQGFKKKIEKNETSHKTRGLKKSFIKELCLELSGEMALVGLGNTKIVK